MLLTDVRDLIEQFGLKVSDVAATNADFYVCLREEGTVSPFTDNLTGACADCGHRIIFRPHAPPDLPRICIQCAVRRLPSGGLRVSAVVAEVVRLLGSEEFWRGFTLGALFVIAVAAVNSFEVAGPAPGWPQASLLIGGAVALLVLLWLLLKWVAGALVGHVAFHWLVRRWQKRRAEKKSTEPDR